MSLNPVDGGLIRTQGRVHVKTEAEAGVMLLKAEEHQGPLEAARG